MDAIAGVAGRLASLVGVRLGVNGITVARWNDYFLITWRQVDYYGIHQLPGGSGR